MLRICFEGRCVNWDVKKNPFYFEEVCNMVYYFVGWYSYTCGCVLYWCMYVCCLFWSFVSADCFMAIVTAIIYFPIVLFPNFIVWYFSLSSIFNLSYSFSCLNSESICNPCNLPFFTIYKCNYVSENSIHSFVVNVRFSYPVFCWNTLMSVESSVVPEPWFIFDTTWFRETLKERQEGVLFPI